LVQCEELPPAVHERADVVAGVRGRPHRGVDGGGVEVRDLLLARAADGVELEDAD
jgi:hypothetical protein